jgi:hypothetical protein
LAGKVITLQAMIDWSSATTDKMSLQILIETVAKAGYEVRKIERDGG